MFTVWMLIIGTSVLMVVIMFVVISKLEHQLVGDSDQFSAGQLSWFIFGALVKQGSTLSPSADVSRSNGI